MKNKLFFYLPLPPFPFMNLHICLVTFSRSIPFPTYIFNFWGRLYTITSVCWLSYVCKLYCAFLGESLRYFVPQVPITGKMMNGYPMFSVKNIVQNVKLIEVWDKNLAPLHFVISKS